MRGIYIEELRQNGLQICCIKKWETIFSVIVQPKYRSKFHDQQVPIYNNYIDKTPIQFIGEVQFGNKSS